MKSLGSVLLAVGSLICAINFYLSFLRYPLFKLRGKAGEYRCVSGIPVIGSAFVVVALLLLRGPISVIVFGIVMAIIDTAGFHWFLGTMAWMSLRERCRRRRH